MAAKCFQQINRFPHMVINTVLCFDNGYYWKLHNSYTPFHGACAFLVVIIAIKNMQVL